MTALLTALLCLILFNPAHAQPDPLIQTLQFYGDSCFGEYDEPQAFIRTNDGGYLLCGYTQRFQPATTQIWLARLDSLGNLLWEDAYGERQASGNSVVETGDGDFVVGGWGVTLSYVPVFALLKVNASGDQV